MTLRATLPAFICLVLSPAPGLTDDSVWPQHRGPGGTGSASVLDPPTMWTESEHVIWKVAIPGRGYSSPVAREGRVWLTTAIETNTREEQIGNDPSLVSDHIAIKLIGLDLETGATACDLTLFEIEKPDPIHTMNSYATPTPVVAPDFIYCDFGTYGSACVDTKRGSTVWKTRLEADHQVGPGSSPTVYGNLFIVVRDGRDAQYLAALDTATGDTVWKTDRPPIENVPRDLKKSFSTPTLYRHAGRDHIVVPCAQWLVGYDPATGKESWRAHHGKGFSIAPQPAVGNGMVYYCTGFGGSYLRAVRIGGSGDVTDSHVVWNEKRWVPTIPSPLLLDSELYWVADNGIACCADAVSGEIIWHKSLGGGHYRASPLYAGGKLYFVSVRGKCTILAPGREFTLLAANEIAAGEEVTATPAFVARTMLLRTHSHLYRIENSPTRPATGRSGLAH